MIASERKPEEVLDKAHLQEYEELHFDIWARLNQIEASIFVLERLEDFPFEYLAFDIENTFWNCVRWNFSGMAILLIHGLINDTEGNAIKITEFKNRILREWITPTEKESYRKTLKAVKFSERVKEIGTRITDIRHKFLAHRLLDPATRLPYSGLQGVTCSELREICEAIKELFNACSFGAETLIPPIRYYCAAKGTSRDPTDIEKILHLVAKDSDFLNEPEHMGSVWPEMRKSKSDREIKTLNEWRKRLGMPEV